MTSADYMKTLVLRLPSTSPTRVPHTYAYDALRTMAVGSSSRSDMAQLMKGISELVLMSLCLLYKARYFSVEELMMLTNTDLQAVRDAYACVQQVFEVLNDEGYQFSIKRL